MAGFAISKLAVKIDGHSMSLYTTDVVSLGYGIKSAGSSLGLGVASILFGAVVVFHSVGMVLHIINPSLYYI